MKTEKSIPRMLGAAFIIVAATSAASGATRSAALGSGGINDILTGASQNAALLRVSNLFEMITAAGILALASLLYVVLKDQGRVAALIALSCWFAEAVTLSISKMGAYALIPLSLEFIAAGSPAMSFYQTLGEFLHSGIILQFYTVHMFFYCIGGILYYSLFVKSRILPRVVSIFGLAAVCVGLVGITAELLGMDMPMMVYIPIGLFELTAGGWLVARGIRQKEEVDTHSTFGVNP